MSTSASAVPTSAIGIHPSSSARSRGAPVGEPDRLTQMLVVLPTVTPGLIAIQPLRGCPSGAVQLAHLQVTPSAPGNLALWSGAARATVADTWDHVACARSVCSPVARAQ